MALSVVLMGVAGSGKTAVGMALARQTGLTFHDGDDYHPPANVAKMASGTPLDDADRQGWLAHLQRMMADSEQAGEGVVLACSALKADYRRQLATPSGPMFIFLDIPPEEAKARLAARQGHFMPASLVRSQFETLERPTHAVHLDATRPLQAVIDSAVTAVQEAITHARPPPPANHTNS